MWSWRLLWRLVRAAAARGDRCRRCDRRRRAFKSAPCGGIPLRFWQVGIRQNDVARWKAGASRMARAVHARGLPAGADLRRENSKALNTG